MLAREYGISRGPLREALSRLEACGLIVRRRNIGASVVAISVEHFLEISYIRESLEGLAARLAAKAMTDTEIDDLKGLLQVHKQDIEQNEGRAYLQKEGNVDFHFRIVQGSKNKRLVALLCNDLYHQLRIYRYQFGMQSPRSGDAFREHENIVAAIAHRDGELAEILMRHHIRRSRENIESLLARNNQTQ
jgi:DNA-binding GntR family transcriptional regulator